MPTDDPNADPERMRVDELLDRAQRATVTDAETEELALYVEQDPRLQERVAEAGRRGALGQGWLDRVYRDEAIQKFEKGRRTQIERITGLSLVGLGYLLHFVGPLVAGPVILAGIILLLYSFIRVRMQAHRDDPYKDIQR